MIIRVTCIWSKQDCIITYWTLVNAYCLTSIISCAEEPVLQMLSKDVAILTLCYYSGAIRTRTDINTVCNLESLRKRWCEQNAFATFWGRCVACKRHIGCSLSRGFSRVKAHQNCIKLIMMTKKKHFAPLKYPSWVTDLTCISSSWNLTAKRVLWTQWNQY